jgi:hypothetical protein
MAELVDALVSNTNEVTLVPVRLRLWVRKHLTKVKCFLLLRRIDKVQNWDQGEKLGGGKKVVVLQRINLKSIARVLLRPGAFLITKGHFDFPKSLRALGLFKSTWNRKISLHPSLQIKNLSPKVFYLKFIFKTFLFAIKKLALRYNNIEVAHDFFRTVARFIQTHYLSILKSGGDRAN